MKAIIEKGKADNSIQSCFISECGIEIIFHNNDLADKFAKSLNIPCISRLQTKCQYITFLIKCVYNKTPEQDFKLLTFYQLKI